MEIYGRGCNLLLWHETLLQPPTSSSHIRFSYAQHLPLHWGSQYQSPYASLSSVVVGSHQPTLHRVIMTHPYFSSCSTLTRTWWEGCVGMSLSLHRCIITASGACILSNHITVFKVLGCFGSGIPHLCSNLIVLSKWHIRTAIWADALLLVQLPDHVSEGGR